MGILTLFPSEVHNNSLDDQLIFDKQKISRNSMSQDYHNRGVFGFANVFDRSQQQQIQRDKLRVEGFEPPQPPPRLVGIEEESTSGIPVYETAGMLSEMFNFQPGEAGVVDSTSTGLLENQIITQSFRNPRTAASAADWFLHRNPVSTINNSDSAMQLFFSNPHQQQQESPSPNPPASTSSTLHMLLPNPSHTGNFSQFSWGGNVNNNNNPNEIHVTGAVQGLSLSLSSSLQHLEAEEELRISTMGGGDHHGGGMLFFGQSHVGSSSHNNVYMLRNSKYAKATQELLEEFCSVGYRGHHFKNSNKMGTRQQDFSYNNQISEGGIGVGNSKEHQPPPLSAADRLEHQRRKVKLLSMLDEVDRRYNHYCEQMHMVVNSFDMVMGCGAAVPYTTPAQKAMSRHFRCLKDAINTQLKNSCELLGEKDVGTSGVTKGETPRLRVLEQSLRQQRTFHHIGMMDQEAWRPQRGLPERSVNILRAWLFEHFLHPYPSDADKHLLARQTGLSRSQVSNWFINARVRLWKPMVEEMYQKESKEDTTEDQDLSSSSAQTPPFDGSATAITTPASITPPPPQPPHFFSENLSYNNVTMSSPTGSTTGQPFLGSGDINDSSSMIRFGTSGGDVSLTLGLRHVGELPENNPFSVSNFGGC